MTSTAFQVTTLEEFAQRPNLEESPAWELFNGQVLQKPMPTFHHSRLQKCLVAAIDAANSPYEAFPELRCVLSQNSIVPDIAAIHKTQIPTRNEPFQGAPNWLIEILSPDQSTTKLIEKIQICVDEGAQLGWLIDSQESIIMVFLPDQSFRVLKNESLLPVLSKMTLQLTPNQIFGWL
jgi:Uma2 family endonuclease